MGSHGSGGHGGSSHGGGGLGALMGGHGSSGGHGGYGGYGGYPQQPVYVQQGHKKSSHAGRNAALAAGGGLVGGLLIADAIDDIGDDFQEQAAYEQGNANPFNKIRRI
jgi:hypothetical protein